MCTSLYVCYYSLSKTNKIHQVCRSGSVLETQSMAKPFSPKQTTKGPSGKNKKVILGWVKRRMK